MSPLLKGAGDVLTRLPSEVTLVTSAFSVSSWFFLVNSALTSASGPSGRVWGSEELPTAEEDQL